jgi:hypothetical protein
MSWLYLQAVQESLESTYVGQIDVTENKENKERNCNL